MWQRRPAKLDDSHDPSAEGGLARPRFTVSSSSASSLSLAKVSWEGESSPPLSPKAAFAAAVLSSQCTFHHQGHGQAHLPTSKQALSRPVWTLSKQPDPTLSLAQSSRDESRGGNNLLLDQVSARTSVLSGSGHLLTVIVVGDRRSTT